MSSKDPKQNEGFFASIASSLSKFGSAMTKSVNGLLGYEGLGVINQKEAQKMVKRKQGEEDGNRRIGIVTGG